MKLGIFDPNHVLIKEWDCPEEKVPFVLQEATRNYPPGYYVKKLEIQITISLDDASLWIGDCVQSIARLQQYINSTDNQDQIDIWQQRIERKLRLKKEIQEKQGIS